MTEENICNDNGRKTVRGKKETEASIQMQKQSEIEREASECQLLFENQNSEFKKSSYASILKPISHVPKLNTKITGRSKSALCIRPLANYSVISKVSCYLGLTSSMSRGCLGLSGIWSVVGVVVLLVAWVGGSEFPERECCDPVYPPNTATTAAAPITPQIPKLAGQWFYSILFKHVFYKVIYRDYSIFCLIVRSIQKSNLRF